MSNIESIGITYQDLNGLIFYFVNHDYIIQMISHSTNDEYFFWCYGVAVFVELTIITYEIPKDTILIATRRSFESLINLINSREVFLNHQDAIKYFISTRKKKSCSNELLISKCINESPPEMKPYHLLAKNQIFPLFHE
jgi:hypothetical protein